MRHKSSYLARLDCLVKKNLCIASAIGSTGSTGYDVWLLDIRILQAQEERNSKRTSFPVGVDDK
ncbi:hypothetical protein ANO11243_018290 [Dothideomycetidae sp. 11243]|nr:hypothetical protein ANO11243_018290 [fungal sp. No.11243]